MHDTMKIEKKNPEHSEEKGNGMDQGICRIGKREKKKPKHEKSAEERRVSRSTAQVCGCLGSPRRAAAGRS